MQEIVQMTFTVSGKTAAELKQEHEKAKKLSERQFRKKYQQQKKNLEKFHKKWDPKHVVSANKTKTVPTTLPSACP